MEKEVQEWKKEAVKWEEEVQRLREMMWLDLGGGKRVEEYEGIEACLRREEEVSIMRELVEGLENSVVVLMVEGDVEREIMQDLAEELEDSVKLMLEEEWKKKTEKWEAEARRLGEMVMLEEGGGAKTEIRTGKKKGKKKK